MHSLLAVLAIVSGAYDPGTVPPESMPQPRSSGRVVHVGRRGIQAAVDRARPGDTVRIRRGTYRARVEIRGASKRGVTLIGDGATIDGAVGVRGTGVVVRRSSGGTIARVLVRSAPVGISLADSPAAVRATRTFVRDVTVQGNATGIALDAVRAVTVSRARVLGNATGVAATSVREAVLADSDITGSHVGVAVAAGSDLLLSGNRLRSNGSDVTTGG
jgi:nitrous oxidase accessory protein NosD